MRSICVCTVLAALPAIHAFAFAPLQPRVQPSTSLGCRVAAQRAAPSLASQSRPSIALRMAEGDEFDMSAFFAEVDKRDEVTVAEGEALTGESLRDIVMARWKYPLEIRLHRRRDAFGVMTIWLQIQQVMWKHLWEQSFPMTQDEYNAQNDAVAWYINEWGRLTVNGGARTVMIKLALSEEQQAMLSSDQ